jgi:molybdenum cofactor cytidylyltransferase
MNKTCCVIVAAGLSSRMGRYKPLLPIEGEPAIVHLITTMQKAGVSHCVIVTGYRADDLRAACCNLENISFVHNPDYATTDMLDSAKIGFRAVPNRYDRVFFTPADIPLIPGSVIQGLLQRTEALVYPSYRFKKGHPVSIDVKYLEPILAFTGDGGLRGAFASLSVEPAYLETDDPGILMDMDTPDDYQNILQASHKEDSSCNSN